MTVLELKECLDRMKTIYDYKDGNTALHTGTGAGRNCVEIETTDEKTGVIVHLTSYPLRDMPPLPDNS